MESKLLTSKEQEELEIMKKEILNLEDIIRQQQKEIAHIDAKLQQTEADWILVEGPKKIIVLNKIEYLRHMNMHPSGLVLHPDIM